jgi:hypothetical protein
MDEGGFGFFSPKERIRDLVGHLQGLEKFDKIMDIHFLVVLGQGYLFALTGK